MIEVLACYSEKFHCSVLVLLQDFLRIEGRFFLHSVESWLESRSVGLRPWVKPCLLVCTDSYSPGGCAARVGGGNHPNSHCAESLELSTSVKGQDQERLMKRRALESQPSSR